MNPPNDSKALTIRLPWWGLAPILLLIVQVLAFVANGCQVSGNTIDDADSLMRLAWLREAVARGSWDGGFFDRNGAPWGMVLHWTLPFNLLILGIAKLFWFLPFAGQLQEAGFWTGPILRLAVAFAGYWAARQSLSRRASAFAACLILFSPYMLNYADQGTANHHPLLYLDTVLAAGFALALTRLPQARWTPVCAGVVVALCLWCSFELVVVAGGFFAWLFLLWVREGSMRVRQILLSSAAFATSIDAALLIDPPNGSLSTIVYDHISMPLQTLACLPLAAGLCLSLVRGSAMVRLACAGFAAAVLGGLYLAAWPGVVAGVEGAMDPYVKTEWLSDIGEVRPIHSYRTILLYLGPAMLGVLLTPLVTRRWIDRAVLAIGLLGLCAMGQAHYRFADYAVIAGALALAAALDRMLTRRRSLRVIAVSLAVLLAGSFYSVEMLSSVFDISLEHLNDDKPPANNGTVAGDGRSAQRCKRRSGC